MRDPRAARAGARAGPVLPGHLLTCDGEFSQMCQALRVPQGHRKRAETPQQNANNGAAYGAEHRIFNSESNEWLKCYDFLMYTLLFSNIYKSQILKGVHQGIVKPGSHTQDRTSPSFYKDQHGSVECVGVILSKQMV